jgi:4,5-dihydroxyphthalate decarboxylase
MADLRLTLACGAYDHTLALQDGSVKPDGIELTYLARLPLEIFARMLLHQEFDVSEMSLTTYVALLDRGDCPFVAIPVFPSRVFRHGYIFVNTERGIERPADLAGRRGGVPDYGMAAAVWVRGLLQHEYGVRPSQVEWVQGGAARLERPLPPDVRLTRAPARTDLDTLLAQGEIDFLVAPFPPSSFRRGVPTVGRLFPDYKTVEQDYYRRTRIYPIMHVVVIRRALYERHPWMALSLYQAFCAAKERGYRRLLELGSAQATMAWLQPALDEEQALLGRDHWPYGVEANRPTLAALLQYLPEQGLTDRQVAVEELFAPSTVGNVPGVGQ